MVWGFKENKFSVNALHKVVMETSFIFKRLQKLGISRVFVYFTINRYIITFSVENHKDGWSRAIRTTKVIYAVRPEYDETS